MNFNNSKNQKNTRFAINKKIFFPAYPYFKK